MGSVGIFPPFFNDISPHTFAFFTQPLKAIDQSTIEFVKRSSKCMFGQSAYKLSCDPFFRKPKKFKNAYLFENKMYQNICMDMYNVWVQLSKKVKATIIPRYQRERESKTDHLISAYHYKRSFSSADALFV